MTEESLIYLEKCLFDRKLGGSLMSVMVTGGTGFVGGHVLRELLGQGRDLIAFDYLPNVESVEDIADQIEIVKGDVRDLAEIIDVVKKYGVKYVVHTASLLTVDSQKKPFAALGINVEGTVNILEAARLMDLAQVVYMSSTAVYGYTEEGKVVDEEYPQKPNTVYGATKLLCEHYGLNYNREFGLGFIALRFPIIYGPWQSSRGFSSFKEIIEKPLLGEPARVPIGGDQKYEGVYVKDVARAIVSACFAREPKHRIFNIGTGEMHTLHELADIVRKIIPDAVFEIGPGFDIAEPIRGPLNIKKAKEELGYKPRFALEEGVKNYIEVLKHMPLMLKD
jgi:UDP-glucose 4-epimerase